MTTHHGLDGTANPRIAVVINPAKIADLAVFRGRLEAEFARLGHEPPGWWETTVDDPGRGQTRQAIEAGAEVILACGGDGTVAACIRELVDRPVALAILPAGTGNLLAKNLDLPTNLAGAVAAATGPGRRRIDVGEADGRTFAVMAGIGFDARFIASTSDVLKARVGWIAYVIAGLRHLRDRRMRVRIRLDDAAPFQVKARAVLVANLGRLQAGIELMPDASPYSGKLHVAVLKVRTLLNWLQLLGEIIIRRPHKDRLAFFECERVQIRCDRPEPRELDGDLLPATRSMNVAVRPEALLICVPAVT